MKTSSFTPCARRENLIVQPVDGELILYDSQRDAAHLLNTTAMLVWQHCDGSQSVQEIAQSVAAEAHAPVDESAVWYALEQLERDHLLDGAGAVGFLPMPSLTRREFLKKTALAAAAVPVIKTLQVPNPNVPISTL